MKDSNTELLSTTELARELGLDVKTVRAAITQGQVPVVRVGQRNMVSRKALYRWLDGTTKPAA